MSDKNVQLVIVVVDYMCASSMLPYIMSKFGSEPKVHLKHYDLSSPSLT